MREALDKLRSILQREDVLEEDCRNQAIHRYGDILEDNEKITPYIDGLYTTIQKIVPLHCESRPHRELTFEVLAHFVQ